MSNIPDPHATRQYVLDHFLVGEDPDNLTLATPLVTGGIVDSLGLLDLVAFIEETYGVEFQAHEVDPTQFDTLASINALLQRKLGQSSTNPRS